MFGDAAGRKTAPPEEAPAHLSFFDDLSPHGRVVSVLRWRDEKDGTHTRVMIT